MNPKQEMLTRDRLSLEDPLKRQRPMRLLCTGALGLAPSRALPAGWFSNSPITNLSNEQLELPEAIVGRETPEGSGKEFYEK